MDTITPTNGKAGINNHKARNICLALVIGLILVILLLVVLALTVFKPKQVTTTINSVDLNGFQLSPDITRLKLDLNVTVLINLYVKNPNEAGFKYGNDSTSLLYYRGDVVGQALIPAGNISPGGTTKLNTKLTVLADRLLSNSEIFTDVLSGTLPLTTYTKISGKVTVLKIFKHHMVSSTWCDHSIDISTQSLSTSKCRYKTKL